MQAESRRDTDPVAGLADEHGSRKEIRFIGSVGERLFSATHYPARTPVGSVLICSPIHSEFLANYRREVRLANELAAAGFVVERFHYRGSGHSDGESGGLTLESMTADALVAADWLKHVSAVERTAILGTRLASLVAAGVATAIPNCPLVLWEPTLDGTKYFAEILRLRRMQDMKSGNGSEPAVQPLEALRRQGALDVLGFTIDVELYQSFQGRSLHRVLGNGVPAILLAQLDPHGRTRSSYVSLLEQFRQAGMIADGEVIVGQETWWFPGLRWHDGSMSEVDAALIERTTGWLKRRFQA